MSDSVGTEGWLYHVTFYRNLGHIAEHGLQPGSGRGIGSASYDEHRRGYIFLSDADGVPFWAERAEQWAEHTSDDLYGDELVPVVVRIRASQAPGCEDDELGSKDSGAEAFRCRAVDPGELEVWAGDEHTGSWVPIEEWDQIDLDSAFQDVDDDEERSLRSAFPGPLIPDDAILERQANPRAARSTAQRNPAAQLRAPLALVLDGRSDGAHLVLRTAIFDPRQDDPSRAIVAILDAYGRAPDLHVENSAARRKYGPVLYQVAMAWAADHSAWLRPSRLETSSAARELWKRFLSRSDVECIDNNGSFKCRSAWPPGAKAAAARGEKYVDDLARKRGVPPDHVRDELLINVSGTFWSKMYNPASGPKRNVMAKNPATSAIVTRVNHLDVVGRDQHVYQITATDPTGETLYGYLQFDVVGDIAYISEIRVRRAHRRKGVATALYKALYDFAAAENVRVQHGYMTAEGYAAWSQIAPRIGQRAENPSSLEIKSSRVDESATKSLRRARLRARSQGDLESAALQAGHYAKRTGKTYYGYSGNSFGWAVWRTTYKLSDALNPINNSGRRLFSVSPDLTFTWHDIGKAGNPSNKSDPVVLSADEVRKLPVGSIVFRPEGALVVISGERLTPLHALPHQAGEGEADGDPVDLFGSEFLLIRRGNGTLPTQTAAQRAADKWWKGRSAPDASRRNPTTKSGATMGGDSLLAKGVRLRAMRVDQRLWIQAFPLSNKRGAEPVGHVSIERKDEVQDYGCRRDVTSLRRSVRRTLDAPYLVSGSFVHPQWRGTHLGAALYWAAAMTASGENPEAFIMAGACDLDETSAEALRVWKSFALRRVLAVRGRVATPTTLPKHPFKIATLTFDEDGFLDFPPDDTRSNPEEDETVKIGGVVYTLAEHYLPGSAVRSQGGPVLNLVAPDGTVAGSITLRRGRRGFAAIRKGVAKELSPFTALKLYEGPPSRNPFSMDDFDFEDPEPSRRDPLGDLQGHLGIASAMDPSEFFKDTKLLTPGSPLYYFRSSPAWSVKIDAKDEKEAKAKGKRVFKALKGKRSVASHVPHVHDLPLYVIYDDAWVRVGPSEAKPLSKAGPVSTVARSKADQKRDIVYKGESTFGRRSIRITGSEGAYSIEIHPTVRELKVFKDGFASAPTLKGIDTKLDEAIAAVQKWRAQRNPSSAPKVTRPRTRRTKVWYHGGPELRTDFRDQRWDRDRTTSSLNEEGPGIYFTDQLSQAQGYGPYVVQLEVPADLVLLQKKRPTFAELKRFYDAAPNQRKEFFMHLWGIDPASEPQAVDAVLRKYANQTTLHDALVTLYGDMFQFNAEDWISAMRELGYDGAIVPKNYGVNHLIVWAPEKLRGHVHEL